MPSTERLDMCFVGWIINLLVKRSSKELNTMASVRERTVPTNDRRLSAKCQLLRIEGAMWSARRIPMAVFSDF
jgi:hypothetical protein